MRVISRFIAKTNSDNGIVPNYNSFSGGGSTTVAPVHDGYVLQKVTLSIQVELNLPK